MRTRPWFEILVFWKHCTECSPVISRSCAMFVRLCYIVASMLDTPTPLPLGMRSDLPPAHTIQQIFLKNSLVFLSYNMISFNDHAIKKNFLCLKTCNLIKSWKFLLISKHRNVYICIIIWNQEITTNRSKILKSYGKTMSEKK